MIRITTGSTRIDKKIYTPESGPFATDEAIEARLIALNVAEKVEEPVATVIEARSEAYTAPEVDNAYATASNAFSNESDVEDADGTDTEADEFRLDEERLNKCSLIELKKIAADMKLDSRKLRSKASYVAAICASEPIPELDVGEPIL